MAGHRGFDEQLQALEALRGTDAGAGLVAELRKFLAQRNNFVVAKAAQIVEAKNLAELTPELQQAFEGFFLNAAKSDPQCWAKNALSHALAALGCTDKEVFLRGLYFRQMEPTWGGSSDSAGTLRSTCAHALLACDGLTDQQALLLLTDLLADQDKRVRMEAVLAIARTGPIALPVLRLRALILGEDPEVMATLFNALLTLDLRSSLPLVTRFLEAGDDVAAEAAFALAQTRSPDALQALLARRTSPEATDPWFAAVLVNAIAATRMPAAADFLVEMIEREDRDSASAIEALCKLFSNRDVRARLARAVEATGSPRLTAVLKEHFGRGEP